MVFGDMFHSKLIKPVLNLNRKWIGRIMCGQIISSAGMEFVLVVLV